MQNGKEKKSVNTAAMLSHFSFYYFTLKHGFFISHCFNKTSNKLYAILSPLPDLAVRLKYYDY